MESKKACILLDLYYKFTGYSFNHLGRLFLRLFVGLMIVQFGLRQLMGPECESEFSIPYLAVGLPTWLIIITEIICPFFIMIGLLTRVMIIPPLVLMLVACRELSQLYGMEDIISVQLMSIPFLFMGIFGFLLLSGSGKISIDYYLSLYLINRDKGGKEEDLEEV